MDYRLQKVELVVQDIGFESRKGSCSASPGEESPWLAGIQTISLSWQEDI